MKPARLIVLGIAGLAACGAALLMARSGRAPAPVMVERKASVQTTDVLVTTAELPIGSTIKPGQLRWQPWPADYVPGGALTQADLPGGIQEFDGAIVRIALFAGEPVRREKLVRANSNAFMSAILPSGMRAVAITIDRTGSSSAGGFVLPNDRVDIMKTYREEDGPKGAGDSQTTETILRNIRVLAIGQNVQDKNGEKVVIGDTATLEVSPSQAETLALAQKTGSLSLALRSLADANPAQADETASKDDPSITLVRYGVARQAARR
ncbi:Flp pilus assembly protein CpaB [Enterovirga sp.]|uniref:Flp pilus assembly protein CpaB n=1 Tax=Enterovirga sp. TaxID=2026350 RepID=UPI002CD19CE7|nr:Flp pilus assembly protein CpaB [Enterovirga sp.]HMO28086.1 Flp pilus assembly protein CpaB [Enterovirga sp.]